MYICRWICRWMLLPLAVSLFHHPTWSLFTLPSCAYWYRYLPFPKSVSMLSLRLPLNHVVQRRAGQAVLVSFSGCVLVVHFCRRATLFFKPHRRIVHIICVYGVQVSDCMCSSPGVFYGSSILSFHCATMRRCISMNLFFFSRPGVNVVQLVVSCLGSSLK